MGAAVRCKHCRDYIDPKQKCDTCKKAMKQQCQTCHNELAHGIVRNHNIQITHSGHEGLTPRQRSKLKA